MKNICLTWAGRGFRYKLTSCPGSGDLSCEGIIVARDVEVDAEGRAVANLGQLSTEILTNFRGELPQKAGRLLLKMHRRKKKGEKYQWKKRPEGKRLPQFRPLRLSDNPNSASWLTYLPTRRKPSGVSAFAIAFKTWRLFSDLLSRRSMRW